MPEIVKIEVTAPLPGKGAVGGTYRIEGTVKAAEKIGAPPWVYAQAILKSWLKPEIIEETHYYRGLPVPVTGEFKIDWTPAKAGIYEVTVVATPAPLSLPVIGVPPITGQSDMMKVTVEKLAYDVSEFKIVSYGKEGKEMVAPGTKITVDPGNRIRIDVEFTYQGPAWRETLYGVLYTGVEDEISGSAGTAALDIPESFQPTKITGAYVVIPVPNRPGETFGILVKLGNIAKDKIANVVAISGVKVPTVTGFKITGYNKV